MFHISNEIYIIIIDIKLLSKDAKEAPLNVENV